MKQRYDIRLSDKFLHIVIEDGQPILVEDMHGNALDMSDEEVMDLIPE